MIAGFEVPDEGRVILQGRDVTSVFSNRRPVNMVFQQYALFPHMSIYDNVAFGLKVKRVSRKEHRGRVLEILRSRTESCSVQSTGCSLTRRSAAAWPASRRACRPHRERYERPT